MTDVAVLINILTAGFLFLMFGIDTKERLYKILGFCIIAVSIYFNSTVVGR